MHLVNNLGMLARARPAPSCDTLHDTMRCARKHMHSAVSDMWHQFKPGEESPTHLAKIASVYLVLISSNLGATTLHGPHHLCAPTHGIISVCSHACNPMLVYLFL